MVSNELDGLNGEIRKNGKYLEVISEDIQNLRSHLSSRLSEYSDNLQTQLDFIRISSSLSCKNEMDAVGRLEQKLLQIEAETPNTTLFAIKKDCHDKPPKCERSLEIFKKLRRFEHTLKVEQSSRILLSNQLYDYATNIDNIRLGNMIKRLIRVFSPILVS